MDDLVLLQMPQGEDRLGALTDDILLSILRSVDLATAARTSALSTRWRSLPWLLLDLDLHVRDFLPAPCPDYPVAAGQQIYFYSQIPWRHIDQAMASLTRAARSFLRIKHSSRISRMSLEIYLVGNYSHDIGPLVRDAIDNGMVKELDLTIAVLRTTRITIAKVRICYGKHGTWTGSSAPILIYFLASQGSSFTTCALLRGIYITSYLIAASSCSTLVWNTVMSATARCGR